MLAIIKHKTETFPCKLEIWHYKSEGLVINNSFFHLTHFSCAVFYSVFMFSLVRESGSHNPPEQLLCNCEGRRSPIGQLDRKRLGIVSWFSDCDSAKGQLPKSLLGKSQELDGSMDWTGMEVKSTFCISPFTLLVTFFCHLLASFPLQF